MLSGTPPTGYARLTPVQARLVLAGLAVLAIAFVAITLSPLASTRVGKRMRGEGDIALYWAEVERVRAGEGYYEAAAVELVERGYPTRSVFNWRTPLPMWMVGKLPHPLLAKVLLGLLALAVMLLSFEGLAREQGHGVGRPVACALLLTGPLMFCVLGNLYVSPMLWAGVFIAVSIGAYGVGRPGWGAAMVGFAGWHTPWGQRTGLTVCLFVLAFGFVGQGFNQYCGTLVAPLFCFGVVQFPASLRDLWRAAAVDRMNAVAANGHTAVRVSRR